MNLEMLTQELKDSGAEQEGNRKSWWAPLVLRFLLPIAGVPGADRMLRQETLG